MLPKSERLVNQLCGLERRTARSGKDSIDHGPGGHDDLANAVAGAADLVGSRKQLVITAAMLEQARMPTSYSRTHCPRRARWAHGSDRDEPIVQNQKGNTHAPDAFPDRPHTSGRVARSLQYLPDRDD